MQGHNHKTAVTLLELLVAISLLSLIILGFSSIEVFSRYQVTSSDRRAQLQNEVTYVVEHMTKEIGKAIGDINQLPIVPDPSSTATRIVVVIDQNLNGIRDAVPPDRQIAYSWNFPNMAYYSDYPDGSSNNISNKISNFSWTVADNYVFVEVRSCDDPDEDPAACNTPDNPQVTMRTNIRMPSVSTN